MGPPRRRERPHAGPGVPCGHGAALRALAYPPAPERRRWRTSPSVPRSALSRAPSATSHTSAFVAAFRKETGVTPSLYFGSAHESNATNAPVLQRSCTHRHGTRGLISKQRHPRLPRRGKNDQLGSGFRRSPQLVRMATTEPCRLWTQACPVAKSEDPAPPTSPPLDTSQPTAASVARTWSTQSSSRHRCLATGARRCRASPWLTSGQGAYGPLLSNRIVASSERCFSVTNGEQRQQRNCRPGVILARLAGGDDDDDGRGGGEPAYRRGTGRQGL